MITAYAVIMAGGRGERFWPQSRASHPKQLLRLMGNLTMVEQAAERLNPLVPPEHTLVITHQEYVNSMRQLLPRIPAENIIGEYIGKDTAGCLALATGVIRQRAGGTEPVIVAAPADHIIRDVEKFRTVLADAIQAADRTGKLVTLGISPRSPNTGFGYIKAGDPMDAGTGTVFRKVVEFREKPDLPTAEKFVANGAWRWNSGIFIWRSDVFLESLKQLSPGLYALANAARAGEREHNLSQVLSGLYQKIDSISIDYAILEKSDNLLMGEADFDWMDIGSWQAIRSQTRSGENNNVTRGLFAQLDCHDCSVVTTPGHLVAAIDVDNLIIVHTDDATLVCSAGSAQRVKELVQKLNQNPELRKFL